MQVTVDLTKVVPSSQIKGEDEQETLELKKMLKEAEDYLSSFNWCIEIKKSYMGIGIGGVIGVFLSKLKPSSDKVDEWVWVIVGDLPPAYITAEHAPNPACALDAYIGAMSQWVEAARSGHSVEDLIPVNVPPTPENAQRLQSRLDFLDKEILSQYSDDLKAE